MIAQEPPEIPALSNDGWHLQTMQGSVGELHALEPPTPAVPTVWVMEPARAALVLGSGQRMGVPPSSALLADANVDLALRRSGGGAVLIRPDDVLWVDVLIPAESPDFSDDLGRTFQAVGEVWRRALASLDIETEVTRQRPVRSALSDAVCFAGVGWGEVVFSGAKFVGLSQRRTRWGARVQCLAIRVDQIAEVAALMAVEYGADSNRPAYATMSRVWGDVLPAFLAEFGLSPAS